MTVPEGQPFGGCQTIQPVGALAGTPGPCLGHAARTRHRGQRTAEVLWRHSRSGRARPRYGQGRSALAPGPNGAGKTTTVEILEGYRRRDSGEARVLGQDPQRAGAVWRARRGIVLQSCEDVVDLTVSECVRHFSHFYPAPADPAEVIEQVGLTAKKDSRIRALSGGQRRRLDVALGIVGRPELVFLDEPTTGFDPEARHQFWGVVRDLAKEGTSVLLTTHYLEEAEALADRVAVINNGKVIEAGPPSELGFSSPPSPLTPPRLAVEGPRRSLAGSDGGRVFALAAPAVPSPPCALSALRPSPPSPAVHRDSARAPLAGPQQNLIPPRLSGHALAVTSSRPFLLFALLPRSARSALRPLRPAPAPPCPRSALPPLRPAPSPPCPLPPGPSARSALHPPCTRRLSGRARRNWSRSGARNASERDRNTQPHPDRVQMREKRRNIRLDSCPPRRLRAADLDVSG